MRERGTAPYECTMDTALYRRLVGSVQTGQWDAYPWPL